jgi:hypothetical protein
MNVQQLQDLCHTLVAKGKGDVSVAIRFPDGRHWYLTNPQLLSFVHVPGAESNMLVADIGNPVPRL